MCVTVFVCLVQANFAGSGDDLLLDTDSWDLAPPTSGSPFPDLSLLPLTPTLDSAQIALSTAAVGGSSISTAVTATPGQPQQLHQQHVFTPQHQVVPHGLPQVALQQQPTLASPLNSTVSRYVPHPTGRHASNAYCNNLHIGSCYCLHICSPGLVTLFILCRLHHKWSYSAFICFTAIVLFMFHFGVGCMLCYLKVMLIWAPIFCCVWFSLHICSVLAYCAHLRLFSSYRHCWQMMLTN